MGDFKSLSLLQRITNRPLRRRQLGDGERADVVKHLR
jgi:hypothetical protein